MTFNDLISWQNQRMCNPQIIENKKARRVLEEYYKKYPKHILEGYYNDIEQLLHEYFSVTNQKCRDVFDELLCKYGFNFKGSIHNAMIYLLSKQKFEINPESWPGVIEVKKNKNQYELVTKVGIINVYKASTLFWDTPSKYVFRKQLWGQCYARTYDFLKINTEYKAVLSYINNLFYGGFYHAYLESENNILDISCNAFYEDKKEAEKVLLGEVIKKLSFEEIEDECSNLEKKIGKIGNDDKLNVLSLYHDRINHNM